MVKGKKITRRQIRQPDEFFSTTEHLLLFVRDHLKKIVVGVGIIVVIVAAFVLFRIWEEKKENEGQQKLNLAMEMVQLVSSPYREGSPVEYKNALTKMEEIVKAFPRTSSGKFALLYKGNIHLKLGEFDEAIKAYDAFLSQSGSERLYNLLALEGLGYAYEGKKDYGKAIEAYQRIVATDQDFQAREARLKMGHGYEKLGMNKEALENYKAYLEGAQKSLMTNLVLRKISLLEK
jgi:tetratricopeptide (TPR) repeat protein